VGANPFSLKIPGRGINSKVWPTTFFPKSPIYLGPWDVQKGGGFQREYAQKSKKPASILKSLAEKKPLFAREAPFAPAEKEFSSLGGGPFLLFNKQLSGAGGGRVNIPPKQKKFALHINYLFSY